MENILKKICPLCGEENSPGENKCRKCNYVFKKRRFPLLALILVILLLALFAFMERAGFEVETDSSIPEKETRYVIREITRQVPVERIVCQNRSFRFSTLGGNVESIGANVMPNLKIINLDSQWGVFWINFSYVDQSRFPYETYGGPNLKDALASGKISIKDADFQSDNYGFYIGPGEYIDILNKTRKKNTSKSYWAIASIKEPTMTECFKKSEYKNITENKTFSEEYLTGSMLKKKEFKTVKEIIGIKGFFEYIMICLLLAIIIMLAIGIYKKARQRNLEKRI